MRRRVVMRSDPPFGASLMHHITATFTQYDALLLGNHRMMFDRSRLTLLIAFVSIRHYGTTQQCDLAYY